MEYALLGFFTGLSLILAIGAQNIFVIEQGLKKQHVFLVCFICSVSDLILIFFGIFLFHFFNQYFNPIVEFIFNLLLVVFLIHFIYSKIKTHYKEVNFQSNVSAVSRLNILLKTLWFTYLNKHVYSDTVFILGNFSKNYLLNQKFLFAIGASLASFLFFFILGYLSNYLSKYANDKKIWQLINILIIVFMSFLVLFILKEMIIKIL
jgi:L-lysine exporter family protein LysE/ArgO